MANRDALIKQLEQEGFTQVRICPLPPNKDLPQHTHDEHTIHIILEGVLTITQNRKSKTYKPGDRVEFPAGTTHKARGKTDSGKMIIGVKEKIGGMIMTQKIIPHLWFDKEAKEAAKFYTSIFPNSKVTTINTIHDTPTGDCDIVSFELAGQKFMAISAGPYFKFTPAISFIVGCETREEVDQLWDKLSKGGKILMPLDTYPFSERYGWTEDKYGLSWQLILTKPEGEDRPKIVPSLLFVKKKSGKAKQARDFYLSVFKNSKEGRTIYYEEDTKFYQKKDDVMFSDFRLENMWIAAMDGGSPHEFDFNEAVSFIVKCDTQEEIDYYWKKLSADPKSEQCGWLKDKFGVSWQIVPTILDKMMSDKDEKKVAQVTQAFLKMKKFDIKILNRAYQER